MGHQPGAGRHKGRLGALLVRAGGRHGFAVGTGLLRRGARGPAAGRQRRSRSATRSCPTAACRASPPTSACAIDARPGPLPAATKPVTAPTAAGGKRRFEFAEGTSNKFWEVSISGCDLTTRWGKAGTDGQSKTKTFADAARARAEANKLIAEKTAKGYIET